jgi:hypothetical protein
MPETKDQDEADREDGARATQDPRADRSLARDLQDEGRAGKGINQAGFLKDEDAAGPAADPS